MDLKKLLVPLINGNRSKRTAFGFEPEVVAKIAQQRLRIYEKGISYRGRTYAEGKKIGMKDGFRALYCILKYNPHNPPWIVQFFFYILIGGVSAIVNLLIFLFRREAKGVSHGDYGVCGSRDCRKHRRPLLRAPFRSVCMKRRDRQVLGYADWPCAQLRRTPLPRLPRETQSGLETQGA